MGNVTWLLSSGSLKWLTIVDLPLLFRPITKIFICSLRTFSIPASISNNPIMEWKLPEISANFQKHNNFFQIWWNGFGFWFEFFGSARFKRLTRLVFKLNLFFSVENCMLFHLFQMNFEISANSPSCYWTNSMVQVICWVMISFLVCPIIDVWQWFIPFRWKTE